MNTRRPAAEADHRDDAQAAESTCAASWSPGSARCSRRSRARARSCSTLTQAKQYYIHVYWETMAAADVVLQDPGGMALYPYLKNLNRVGHYGHYELEVPPRRAEGRRGGVR